MKNKGFTLIEIVVVVVMIGIVVSMLLGLKQGCSGQNSVTDTPTYEATSDAPIYSAPAEDAENEEVSEVSP